MLHFQLIYRLSRRPEGIQILALYNCEKTMDTGRNKGQKAKYTPYQSSLEARRRVVSSGLDRDAAAATRDVDSTNVNIPLPTKRYAADIPKNVSAAVIRDLAAPVPEDPVRSPPPTTLSPTKPDDEDGETLFSAPLSEEKIIQVRVFRGRLSVDIRRWFKDTQGCLIPTRKGIAVTPACWATLLYDADVISQTLARIKSGERVTEKKHISGGVYLQMATPFWTVHLREYYKDKKDGGIKPSRKGVVLKHGEWGRLLQLVPELKRQVPDLAEARPCYLSDDHQNQMGSLMCPECNPFDYGDYLMD